MTRSLYKFTGMLKEPNSEQLIKDWLRKMYCGLKKQYPKEPELNDPEKLENLVAEQFRYIKRHGGLQVQLRDIKKMETI